MDHSNLNNGLANGRQNPEGREDNKGTNEALPPDLTGKQTFGSRLQTFKHKEIAENGIITDPIANKLAFYGFMFVFNLKAILCSRCNYSILLSKLKRLHDLVHGHNNQSPDCMVSQSLKAYASSLDGSADSGFQSSESSASNQSNPSNGQLNEADNQSGTSNQLSDYHSNPGYGQSNFVTPGRNSGALLCPTQSDSRLPVPVNVKSRNGRLNMDHLQMKSSYDKHLNSANDSAHPASSATNREGAIAAGLTDITDGDNEQTDTGEGARALDGNRASKDVKLYELKPVSKPKPTGRFIQYDTYSARLGSYGGWPTGNPMKPAELARAGFVYANEADKVVCAYCDGAIWQWDSTDNAFGEHVRLYPNCMYMKYVTYNNLTSPIPRPVQSDGLQRKDDPLTRLTPSEAGVVMLGYSVELIQNIKAKNPNMSISTDALLGKIFEMERAQNKSLLTQIKGSVIQGDVNNLEGAVGGLNLSEIEPSNSMDSGGHTPASDYQSVEAMSEGEEGRAMDFDDESSATEHPLQANATQGTGSNPNQLSNLVGEVQNDPEFAKVLDEYKRLQRTNICNKCGSKQVNILFLPCRHLVACEECAENMDMCLLCQKEIVGTVKVFLP